MERMGQIVHVHNEDRWVSGWDAAVQQGHCHAEPYSKEAWSGLTPQEKQQALASDGNRSVKPGQHHSGGGASGADSSAVQLAILQQVQALAPPPPSALQQLRRRFDDVAAMREKLVAAKLPLPGAPVAPEGQQGGQASPPSDDLARAMIEMARQAAAVAMQPVAAEPTAPTTPIATPSSVHTGASSAGSGFS